MKYLLLAFSLLSIFLVTSCKPKPSESNSQPAATEPSNEMGADSVRNQDEVPHSSHASDPGEGDAGDAGNQPMDQDQIGWDLMGEERFGGIGLEMDSATIVGILGKPTSKTEPELWGADGLYHSEWRYEKAGIVIGMAQDETVSGAAGENKSFMITVLPNSTFKTLRGIGMGSSSDQVKSAYPEVLMESPTSDDWLIAGTVYGGLMFRLENDAVVEMFLGAMAE